MSAPYPARFEERVRLADGSAATLRPVRAEDGKVLDDLLAALSPEDRRRRFLAPIARLSDALSWRLTHLDYEHSIALVAFAAAEPGAKEARVLGVVRLAATPGASDAEFAIALRSDFQGHGLGMLLMQRLDALARHIGVDELFGHVLRDNERMLHLCREMGFALAPDPDAPELMRARRPLQTPAAG